MEAYPIAPIGAVADVTLGKMLQPKKKGDLDVELPYLHAANIKRFGKTDLDYKVKTMWFSPAEVASLMLAPGDVAVVEGGAVGQSAVFSHGLEGWAFQNSIVRVRPKSTKTLGRFIDYSLQSAVESGEIERQTFSATISHFTAEKVARFRIPLPPLDTQRAIADYLDRETSEIDAMLDKLDGLGRLLEERFRQQLVVAIRGTDAPLVSLGAVSDIALGKMIQPNRKNQTDVYAPYLRAAHVQPGGRLDFDVTDQKMWFVLDELARLNLRRGDVVVVEGGAGFGRPAYLDHDLEGWGFQNSINRVRPFTEKVLGKFIYYAMHLALISGEIELEVSTATIPHFTAEKVARFRIPLPPLDEQERIVQRLDETTARIGAMLAKTQQLKDLLTERRSALITAAVTGQIEVY